MKKNHKRSVFSILALLSISSSLQIVTKSNISEIQKAILICLNFMYLFMISEYIETIIYYKTLKNIFECKNFSSPIIYKFFFNIIPVFSLLIYVLAWTIFSFDSVQNSERAFGILILIGLSYLVFVIQIRYNIVFINKSYLFIYTKMISLEEVITYSLCNKRCMGIRTNIIKIVLKSGEEHSFKMDVEITNELIAKIQK